MTITRTGDASEYKKNVFIQTFVYTGFFYDCFANMTVEFFLLTRPSGPVQSQSCNVRLYVCDVTKHPLPGVVATSGQRT